MKRIIFICSLILLNVNVMAQYYKGDNYQVTFEDDFEDRRYWDRATFRESKNKWRAYLYGYRLTHGEWERQVYQPSQCIFDADAGMAKLVADYISSQITCDEVILPTIPQGVECHDDELEIYKSQYFSGALVSVNNEISYHKYKYGYFEIRCKLPVHQGAFPAFWLWDSKTGEYYEEIDIFEYTWGITNPEKYSHSDSLGDNRCFTAGIYYNETGETDNLKDSCSYGRIYSRLPDSSPSMDEWNTFGCLWLPDRVEWYINDIKVNSYYNSDHIPQHPMHIKANYAINSDLDDIDSFEEYTLSDTMFIDYIRVYQPICDCETNVLIDSQSDLNNYEPGVKRTVTINSSSSTPIIVSSQNDVSIIASEQIVIDKPFKVNAGAKFEAVIQQCPN